MPWRRLGAERAPAKVAVGPAPATESPRCSIGRAAVLGLPLALLTTALEILLSRRAGLLAEPPTNDGVTYLLQAKHLWGLLGSDPWSAALETGASRSPVWVALMLLHFRVGGVGEWQAFTVRFWPAAFLIVVVLWVTWRRATRAVGLVAASATALLPTISVTLRSAAAALEAGHLTRDSYFADLRPDLLFCALLVCSVAALIERSPDLDRPTALFSGLLAGLAVLVKATAFPILLLGWGLSWLWILVNARGRRAPAARLAGWSAVGFGGLLAPWVAAGGLMETIRYLQWGLTAMRGRYTPGGTALDRILYYPRMFGAHMGFEGCVLATAALLAVVIRRRRPGAPGGPLIPYVIASAGIGVLITATPNKNLFLGLPAYFLLWIAAWAVVAEVFRERRRGRLLGWAAACWAAAVVSVGFRAMVDWPPANPGARNRIATKGMAADLGATLSPGDCFGYPPAFGNPATLLYHMMRADGSTPWEASLDPNARCVAVLAFDEDAAVAGRDFTAHHWTTWPLFQGLADSVREAGSGYESVREYELFPPAAIDETRPFKVRLYVATPDLQVGLAPDGWPSSVRFPRQATGEPWPVPHRGPDVLFTSDLDTGDGLFFYHPASPAPVATVPDCLSPGDSCGEYRVEHPADHLASAYLDLAPVRGRRILFSGWVKSRGGPTFFLQDDAFSPLARARVQAQRPGGWLLLAGMADVRTAIRGRVVLSVPERGPVEVDKILVVRVPSP